MFWLSITVLFLVVYAILIFYYRKAWKNLNDYEGTEAANRFISVIVPVRNEEKTISALLKALAKQTYRRERFEIIVVDDYSTDATSNIVKAFPMPNLVLIRPGAAAESSSKKKAIEAGIKFATGELIVTTDADCLPPSNWLETINSFYVATDARFIAAPVKFSHDSSFLQLFQSLDFLTLQGITAATVATDFHTMCNGANLAYTKVAFEEVKGFEGIDRVASGDDMLLMHKIRKHYQGKVSYLKSKDAIVTSQPMLSWRDFFLQRKRWASKTLVYDDYRIIAVLAFVYLFNCLCVALIIAAILNPFYWWGVLAYWIVKTLVELPFVSAVAKFYDEQSLVKYLFPFQPFHIFYTVFVGLISQFGKYEWKGRKTK